MEWAGVFWIAKQKKGYRMRQNNVSTQPLQKVRCAIYTRKSTEEGLDMDFNSLDAQRESAESYIQSQRHEGWVVLEDRYDDGGFSGGSIDRPALKKLLVDIENKKVDCVIVYKVDRISRSLTDFCKIMDIFETHNVSFVSVTQSFNTTSSMGRLTLNILLSFAQFEREVIGERIRDKVAAMRKKGKFTGGMPVLGYDSSTVSRQLEINEKEAELVKLIFKKFIKLRSTLLVAKELNQKGYKTKQWVTKRGVVYGGNKWNKAHVYRLITNHLYIGEVIHKGQYYPGEQAPIISRNIWDETQKIFKEGNKTRGAKTKSTTPALLKDIIKCGHCACSMGMYYTKRRGKSYRYYLCNHASKNGYDTCTVKTVPAGMIEEIVVNQLKRIFQSPELIASTFRSVKQKTAEESERLKLKKFSLEEQLNKLKDQVKNIVYSKGNNQNSIFLNQELSKIDNEIICNEEAIQKIKDQLSALELNPVNEQEVFQYLKNTDKIWDELFPIEQSRIIRLLIDKVVIYPDGIDLLINTNGINSLVKELQNDNSNLFKEVV